jgi:hypothetical protein
MMNWIFKWGLRLGILDYRLAHCDSCSAATTEFKDWEHTGWLMHRCPDCVRHHRTAREPRARNTWL